MRRERSDFDTISLSGLGGGFPTSHFDKNTTRQDSVSRPRELRPTRNEWRLFIPRWLYISHETIHIASVLHDILRRSLEFT